MLCVHPFCLNIPLENLLQCCPFFELVHHSSFSLSFLCMKSSFSFFFIPLFQLCEELQFFGSHIPKDHFIPHFKILFKKFVLKFQHVIVGPLGTLNPPLVSNEIFKSLCFQPHILILERDLSTSYTSIQQNWCMIGDWSL